MFLRFTDLARTREIVRDVKQKFPETEEVFEKFGLRPCCYDCTLEMAARKVGADLNGLLEKLNEAIYRNRGVTA